MKRKKKKKKTCSIFRRQKIEGQFAKKPLVGVQVFPTNLKNWHSVRRWRQHKSSP